MKAISLTNEFGLTKGKVYEILEESAGYFKVKIDNGGITFRMAGLFEVI